MYLLGSRLGKCQKRRDLNLHALLIDHDVETLTVVNGGVEPEECIAFAEGLALTNYQFLKYLFKEQFIGHIP